MDASNVRTTQDLSSTSTSTSSNHFPTRKKKKAFTINAEAQFKELPTIELKRDLADCVGCGYRLTILTILRDLVFAYGTSVESIHKKWPKTRAELMDIVSYIFVLRPYQLLDEVQLDSDGVCGFFRELGVVQYAKQKYSQLQWNMERIEEVMSYLTFEHVEESDTQPRSSCINDNETVVPSLSTLKLGDDKDLPDYFVHKVPEIVTAVAMLGRDEGASIKQIIRDAALRLRQGDQPGRLLRAIPDLKLKKRNNRNRFYLREEDGYDEPFLAGYMSYGGPGVESMRALHQLCLLDSHFLPKNDSVLHFALLYCDMKVPIDKVFECFKYLGVWHTTTKGKRAQIMGWNMDRVEKLLSLPNVRQNLQEDHLVGEKMSKFLPILDEQSLLRKTA